MGRGESRIFYLVGASGSGKDSLLRSCRAQLQADDCCWVAHRYITRAPELVGENHIWLSHEEFEARSRLGAFAMQWRANGQHYAIGTEIDFWLDKGVNVLVNGSRQHLPQAQAAYHHRLVPIWVNVPPSVLSSRLQLRGRETAEQIAARMQRNSQFQCSSNGAGFQIENDGTPEQGAIQLLGILRGKGSENRLGSVLSENP